MIDWPWVVVIAWVSFMLGFFLAALMAVGGRK